jgi:hypothetical protein
MIVLLMPSLRPDGAILTGNMLLDEYVKQFQKEGNAGFRKPPTQCPQRHTWSSFFDRMMDVISIRKEDSSLCSSTRNNTNKHLGSNIW